MHRISVLVPPEHCVTHMHWGGGSPDILSPDDIAAVGDDVRRCFSLRKDLEFAVEADPRGLISEKVEAFAAAGLTRASIGVQDFEPKVQAAINRIQSFETTRAAVELFRKRGVSSLNIDLVYGLPHQTLAGAERTIEAVISLAPDRVALFGYAHVPQRAPHQRLINAATIPDAIERFGQLQAMAERLSMAGYVRIGLDHFARPGDSLAICRMRRNFQGYTTDDADALLGLGASAISRMPQGYAQNAPSIAEYGRLIDRYGLATARGFALGEEDRARAFVIERLMCDLRFPGRELRARFPAASAELTAQAATLVVSDQDGLVEPNDGGFRVTEKGRPFLRTICARFDAYLDQHEGYSMGV